MSKIARKTAVQFGATAGPDQIAQYGSFAASAPAFSTDPAVIQALAQFQSGWFTAVLSNNAPCTEDDNALAFLWAYQIGYLMQAGIAEYDGSTTYYVGSLCTGVGTGQIYVSVADSNTGNALTNPSFWVVSGGAFSNITSTYTVLQTDSTIICSNTAGTFTITLPAIASTPVGKKYTFKNTGGSSGFAITIKGNASELIDLANTFSLTASGSSYPAITIQTNGTQWFIISSH